MKSYASFRAGNPASGTEVCPIELRLPEGRLIRKITSAEADRVVDSGLGFRRGTREVWLFDAAARHDGNPRTWLGSKREGRIRPSKYAHNERVCDGWRPAQSNYSEFPEGKQ